MIDNYNHFSVIVAGDNPDELMKGYDSKVKVPPYVVYKYNEAENLQKKYINIYEEILKSNKFSDDHDMIQNRLEKIKSQDAFDFYVDLTMDYDIDEKTGDAISTDNPNGKWRIYQNGKKLSIPFKLKNNGEETFSALKNNIDWGLIHMVNKEVYESAWDMVVNGKKPSNENEKVIYENMKERLLYFLSFESKEKYVASSTAFWAYAFLSEDTGWVEMDDTVNQIQWITNFYNRFIVPLDNNTRLTIFECVK